MAGEGVAESGGRGSKSEISSGGGEVFHGEEDDPVELNWELLFNLGTAGLVLGLVLWCATA